MLGSLDLAKIAAWKSWKGKSLVLLWGLRWVLATEFIIACFLTKSLNHKGSELVDLAAKYAHVYLKRGVGAITVVCLFLSS